MPFLHAFTPRLTPMQITLAPLAIATGGRVALGDEIGARLGARMVLVLIGERPGLSSPDSLGAYLTFAPRVGRSDSERNCVSNIRAGGLGYDIAAFKLAWLIDAAFRRGLTGFRLKDESVAVLAGQGGPKLASPDHRGGSVKTVTALRDEAFVSQAARALRLRSVVRYDVFGQARPSVPSTASPSATVALRPARMAGRLKASPRASRSSTREGGSAQETSAAEPRPLRVPIRRKADQVLQLELDRLPPIEDHLDQIRG